MGMSVSAGLATTIESLGTTLIPIPDYWTFEDAATVPIVYSTVFYAFVMVIY